MKRCYANYYRALSSNVIVTMLEFNKVLIIELDTGKEIIRKLNNSYFSFLGSKYDFLKLQSMKGTKREASLNSKYLSYIADQYNKY